MARREITRLYNVHHSVSKYHNKFALLPPDCRDILPPNCFILKRMVQPFRIYPTGVIKLRSTIKLSRIYTTFLSRRTESARSYAYFKYIKRYATSQSLPAPFIHVVAISNGWGLVDLLFCGFLWFVPRLHHARKCVDFVYYIYTPTPLGWIHATHRRGNEGSPAQVYNLRMA